MGLKNDIYLNFGDPGSTVKFNTHTNASALGIGLAPRANNPEDYNIRISESKNISINGKAFNTKNVLTSAIITNVDSVGELTIDVQALVGGTIPNDTILVYAYKDGLNNFNIGYYDHLNFTPGNPSTYPVLAHYPICEIILNPSYPQITQQDITDVRGAFDPRGQGGGGGSGGFWQWDVPTLPLDDPNFKTNNVEVTRHGSFYRDLQTVTNEDGNQVKFDWFINSLAPTYTFYARQQIVPDMTLRITGGKNVKVGDTFWNVPDQISAVFVAPITITETHLLFIYDNNGVLDFGIATEGFTPGDPNTYNTAFNGMYPICEVTIPVGTTGITDAMIVNVQPY